MPDSATAGGYLFTENELAAVKMPSMTFLGGREKNQMRGTKTMAELAEKAYRDLAPPKSLLEVMGTNHFIKAATGCPLHHLPIEKCCST